MFDCRLCRFGLILIVCGSVAGQPATEPLARWPKYLEVPLPDDPGPGLHDLLATPALYTQAARADLFDLRLYDARGREIPFAIRHRTPRSEFQAFAPREFNRVTNPDGSVAISLDLGAGNVEHNRVEVTTGGSEYRRAVRIEGGDDGTIWQALANVELRYFGAVR